MPPFCGHGSRGFAGGVGGGNGDAEWPEHEFHKEADMVLDHLQEELDVYLEDLDLGEDTDLQYAMGVLTINLGPLGTFVINKQVPNRQLWLSSPVSGPFRYDFKSSDWVYARDKHRLVDKLAIEISSLCGVPLDLSA